MRGIVHFALTREVRGQSQLHGGYVLSENVSNSVSCLRTVKLGACLLKLDVNLDYSVERISVTSGC